MSRERERVLNYQGSRSCDSKVLRRTQDVGRCGSILEVEVEVDNNKLSSEAARGKS